jgi:hypothetical protein
MAPTRKKSSMSDEHKAALATGRAEGLAVRRYLEALEANKPRRGRKPNSENVDTQLKVIEEKLASADPLKRLHLLQQRKTLQARLNAVEDSVDMDELESAFVDAASEYGKRKGITYGTWREIGVPAEVLRRAGVQRGASA